MAKVVLVGQVLKTVSRRAAHEAGASARQWKRCPTLKPGTSPRVMGVRVTVGVKVSPVRKMVLTCLAAIVGYGGCMETKMDQD